MFGAFIARLLGRTAPVRTLPKEDLAILPDPVAAEIPASRPTDPAPQTAAARQSILSSYARADLALTNHALASREVRRTGPVAWVPRIGGWCINSSTSFPLTVVGGDVEIAHQIREAMDGLLDHDSDDVTEAVAGSVVEHGLRFHEFEKDLLEKREAYRAALAIARGKRKESAGSKDDEVEEEIQSQALDALDLCGDDIGMLIEGEYPSDPAELAAIRGFGYGNLLR
jgi:hypothetical protein